MKTKMYYFNPNNYDLEYITLGTSKEEALNTLKSYLLKKAKDDNYYEDIYDSWKNATIKKLPYEYTIEEYKEGEVIETEIS